MNRVRATTGNPAEPTIAGFTVTGERRVMLLRAVGPSLAVSFGLTDAASYPRLELFDGVGRSIAVAVSFRQNSADVQNEIRQASEIVGAFPLAARDDAVLLALLEPGSYTCVVSTVDGVRGIVLIEGYEVPSLAAVE